MYGVQSSIIGIPCSYLLALVIRHKLREARMIISIPEQNTNILALKREKKKKKETVAFFTSVQ